jgi:sortase A
MRLRRALSGLLIGAGVLLCAIAALHYLRGFEAQRAGRRVLDARGADRHRPAEDPGIVPASPEAGLPQRYPVGQPIARLRIPSAHIDAIVFGGSDPISLEKGPGHVPSTELPGHRSGWNNCVITAHRDSHFRNLGWLRKGHQIDLETPESQQTYYVVSREIVDPNAVRVLAATPKPRLTLITCYPFNFIGPAPKRLVVVAEPRPSPENH